jgi:hypothetical protein
MEYHQVSVLCFEFPPISRAKIRQMHGFTEPYFSIIQFAV